MTATMLLPAKTEKAVWQTAKLKRAYDNRLIPFIS
jgi:hypothetical protein